jgi:hypothetical protein
MASELPTVVYPILGFVVTYLALEVAWHFTACRSAHAGDLKPCIFKEVELAIAGIRK